MILFTVLLISLVCMAIALAISGIGLIAVFGDVLICIGIIALIIKLFKKKKVS